MANQLFCGDNLAVLRRYFADESVDLIYLDPPFKSDQDYNLLFKDKSGQKSESQILAFEDTWEWNKEAEKNLTAVVERGGKVAQIMELFRAHLGETDMLAYLSMMSPRLLELQRVLKPTGSIYLHCDPTASHYLKMLMDGILKFLTSFDFSTGHFNGSANFTGRQTEFLGYQTGAGVTHGRGFGPNDTQKINDYISAHPNVYSPQYLNNPYFSGPNYPQ